MYKIQFSLADNSSIGSNSPLDQAAPPRTSLEAAPASLGRLPIWSMTRPGPACNLAAAEFLRNKQQAPGSLQPPLRMTSSRAAHFLSGLFSLFGNPASFSTHVCTGPKVTEQPWSMHAARACPMLSMLLTKNLPVDVCR